MLHELLLALSGVGGELFVPHPPPPEKPVTFKVPADFPFLHTAERCSLERLAKLGFHYKSIINFLDRQRGRGWTELNAREELIDRSETKPPGLFVQTLCNAINEVLSDYRQLIVDSEKRILNKDVDMNGVVPIAHLSQAFGEYQVILPQLHKLVQEIEDNPVKYHGARLLNLITEKCNTGVPELRTIMLKLLHACHGEMYQHITSWMVYGHLQDSWQRRFVLDDSLIPRHIPRPLAESILFVGKAVAIVRDASKMPHTKTDLPKSLTTLHLQKLLDLSSRPQFHHMELQNVVTIIRNNVAQWLWHVVLTGDKVIECLEAFRKYFLLGQGDLASALVDQFEKLAVSRLTSARTSVVKEQELNSLLVRAQVGSSVENDATFDKFTFKLANDQQTSSSSMFDDFILGVPLRLEYEITWPLDLFVTTEDLSKYGDLFSFLISLRRTQHRLERVWGHLSAMYKYVANATTRQAKDSLLLWRMRAAMIFFVNCLWEHVQMDIIEINFKNLVNRISASSIHHKLVQPSLTSLDSPTSPSSPTHTLKPDADLGKDVETLRDFEDIRLGHSSYIKDLLRGCLVESRVCADTIRKALKCCDQLCAIIERWDGRPNDDKWLENIQKIDQEFRDHTNFLFRTLSGINKTGEGFGGSLRHLEQLLLRLDYSKWYSVWTHN